MATVYAIENMKGYQPDIKSARAYIRRYGRAGKSYGMWKYGIDSKTSALFHNKFVALDPLGRAEGEMRKTKDGWVWVVYLPKIRKFAEWDVQKDGSITNKRIR